MLVPRRVGFHVVSSSDEKLPNLKLQPQARQTLTSRGPKRVVKVFLVEFLSNWFLAGLLGMVGFPLSF